MNDFAPPPDWSLWVGSAGRFLVYSGVAAFLLSAVAWFLNRERLGARAFVAGCVLLFATFVSLATLFVANRFEYEYVWGHSDKANAIPYRIAGVWSGQQGSFLLWACCAAIVGLIAARGAANYRRWYTIVYSLFLGSICGILAYETPFNLNMEGGKVVVPADGVGLSPALQNYWVTIHPPVIFLGFGALTVPFALAMAAMITRNTKDWVPIVRPWSIIALTLTGLGLCMGGFWAYETLGWGGFWMWDPVENTSFVPWVFMAAFTHGLIVQATRGRWVLSNLLLGGLPFISFVYGTFLTRSGLLSETSVHSFAQMDAGALKVLLGFSILYFVGFHILWATRAIQFMKARGPEEEPIRGIHREGTYRLGSMLLVGLGTATAIGMSVPMFMSLAGQQAKVVEEGLYHRVLTWLFIPLVVAMAIGPLVGWKGLGAKALMARVYGVLCMTLVLVGFGMVAVARTPWLAAKTADKVEVLGRNIPLVPWILFIVGICLFAVVANVWRAAELFKRSKLGTAAFLSHIGVCVLMLGLVVSRGFEVKDQLVVEEGGHNAGLGYMIAYQGMTGDVMDRNNKVKFELSRQGEKFVVSPGLYYTKSPDGMLNPMVWPHIERHPLHDVYFTLHPRQTEASEPTPLAPGETGKLAGVEVKFLKMTREGAPGSTGARFGALLEVKGDNGAKTLVNPQMELTSDGIKRHDVKLGRDLLVTLNSISAADGAVVVQLNYQRPIYPVEMFFKPLTILVWLGTGIMTVAGAMAAWYRLPRRREKTVPSMEEESTPATQPIPPSKPEPGPGGLKKGGSLAG